MPVEYDDLHIEAMAPGVGFAERSSMLTMRRWHHDRSVRPTGPMSCTVLDRLAFEPRVPVGAVAESIVGALFRHRHRRLRRRFGDAGAATASA